MALLDNYASQLAGLKKAYGTATTDTQRQDFANQGIQLRHEAYGQGVDLNSLEEAAQKAGGFTTNMSGDAYQAWKNTTFGAAQNMPDLPKPPKTGAQGSTPTNSYMQNVQDLMNTQFSYDPNTDPAYQSYLNLANNQAKKATNNAFESLNDRGIVNSTIATDQANQIQQDAQLQAQSMIPQLQAQAYGMYRNKITDAMSLMNSANDEKYRQEMISGQYMPNGAQDLINEILGDKQGYGNQYATSEQKKGYADDAVQARAKLAAMGYDADKLFGSGVTLDQATKNASSAYLPTMDMRKYNADQEYRTKQLEQSKTGSNDPFADRKLTLQERQLALQERQQTDLENNPKPTPDDKSKTYDYWANQIDESIALGKDFDGNKIKITPAIIENMILTSTASYDDKDRLFTRYDIPNPLKRYTK